MTPKIPDTTRDIAERFVDAMLTNGSFEVGVRFEIVGADGRGLGGWGKGPFVLGIRRLLRDAFAEKDAELDLMHERLFEAGLTSTRRRR